MPETNSRCAARTLCMLSTNARGLKYYECFLATRQRGLSTLHQWANGDAAIGCTQWNAWYAAHILPPSLQYQLFRKSSRWKHHPPLPSCFNAKLCNAARGREVPQTLWLPSFPIYFSSYCTTRLHTCCAILQLHGLVNHIRSAQHVNKASTSRTS